MKMDINTNDNMPEEEMK